MYTVFEYIKKLMDRKYYGTLTIKFENGKIIHAVKEESVKFK